MKSLVEGSQSSFSYFPHEATPQILLSSPGASEHCPEKTMRIQTAPSRHVLRPHLHRVGPYLPAISEGQAQRMDEQAPESSLFSAQLGRP